MFGHPQGDLGRGPGNGKHPFGNWQVLCMEARVLPLAMVTGLDRMPIR
jgi:hypothetical protein